jgi:hypothetical protein
MLPQFKNLSSDLKIFKKIVGSANKIPYPGDLKNIIKTSLAFSNPDNPSDYLRRLYVKLHDKDKNPTDSIESLRQQGFTVREIGLLTETSKTQVARELQDK